MALSPKYLGRKIRLEEVDKVERWIDNRILAEEPLTPDLPPKLLEFHYVYHGVMLHTFELELLKDRFLEKQWKGVSFQVVEQHKEERIYIKPSRRPSEYQPSFDLHIYLCVNTKTVAHHPAEQP